MKLLLSPIAAVVAVLMLAVLSGSPASARTFDKVMPMLEGPATLEYVSPYEEAFACLNKALTPEQKAVPYGVVFAVDKTGKTNYAAPDASGTFLGQGYDDALTTSLKKIGVRVANISPAQRTLFDWFVQKAGAGRKIDMLVPDAMIEVSIGTLDIDPGNVKELNGPVELGTREHRINVTFSGKVTTGPFTTWAAQANETITSFTYTKQIVGYENKAGITTFLGGGLIRSLIGFNISKEGRQPLQYAGLRMMDVTAFRSVRDVSGVTACDEVFRNAETAAHIKTLAAGT